MAEASPVRNNASSAAVDSYELHSESEENDDDEDILEGTFVQARSVEEHRRRQQSLTNEFSNLENVNSLPLHLTDRLGTPSVIETINIDHLNLHFATADFEDCSDKSDQEDDDGETSESGSNSSYTGSAGASTSVIDIGGHSSLAEKSRGHFNSDTATNRTETDSNDECDDDDDCDDDCDNRFMHGSGYERLSNPDTDIMGVGNANFSKQKKSTVISSLKKRWKGMRKASHRSSNETWEERHSRIGDEWINCIIPAWNKKRKTGRVRTLVFRGIPVNVRGRVWKCAIGNPLNISEELFIVLKDRAAKGRAMYQRGRIDGSHTVDIGDLGDGHEYGVAMAESERSAHKAISLDLPRTFPELTFFHAEGSHYEHALRDVLEAFLYLKPDVGYSQGMSFVAAVLLLYMDPYEAFCCFSNMLLYKSCFLNFFRIKMPEVKCYLMVHERFLEEEMPTLFNHFKRYGIDSDLYMINWVMSLYCRALRLDLVTRIWDLYVLDGDVAVFRSALGILRLFMNQLLTMKFEEMAYFLSHIPSEHINADELLQSIRSIRVVSRKKFVDLFQQFRAQHS